MSNPSASADYYAKNKRAGLVRLSVWVRPEDREELLAWLAARALKPAVERRRRSAPDDHPTLF